MNQVLVVIPTYWTWASDQAQHPVTVFFDHPTPLDGTSTLPRLLESLCHAVSEGPPVQVVVLAATAHPSLGGDAERQVAALTAPYQDRLPIAHVTHSELAAIHQRVTTIGHPQIAPHLSLHSYPGVRNCGLALAQMAGASLVVFLDDDECIPQGYVDTALELIASEQQGERILGVAGPYLDAAGGELLPEGPRTGNIFLDKNAWQNEALRALQGTPGRLVRSPLAFGGNMVLHRDLFSAVAFDPWITRGEDIDYAINAWLQGHSIWWDRQLHITHMPPAHHHFPPYVKLSQDVMRFVYWREKLRRAHVDPAELDPYPGRFLRADLEAHARAALEQMATADGVALAGPPEQVLARARHLAITGPTRFAAFAAEWPHCTERLVEDSVPQGVAGSWPTVDQVSG